MSKNEEIRNCPKCEGENVSIYDDGNIEYLFCDDCEDEFILNMLKHEDILDNEELDVYNIDNLDEKDDWLNDEYIS